MVKEGDACRLRVGAHLEGQRLWLRVPLDLAIRVANGEEAAPGNADTVAQGPTCYLTPIYSLLSPLPAPHRQSF